MAWVPPPTFVADQILTATEQNDLSTDLTVLVNNVGLFGAGPQTLVGVGPGTTTPAYTIQAGVATSVSVTSGNWSFNYPVPFTNGVLAVTANGTPTASSDVITIGGSGGTGALQGQFIRNGTLLTGTVDIVYIAIGF